LKQQYPHDFLFCLEEANLRKDAGQGMVAVDAYRQIVADSAIPGYFAEARLELAFFGLGDALRGQRHYSEAAKAYEQAAWTKNVGSELKIRSLLAAGECNDLNGQRSLPIPPAPILRGGTCAVRTLETKGNLLTSNYQTQMHHCRYSEL
jgi:hypothetical protein